MRSAGGNIQVRAIGEFLDLLQVRSLVSRVVPGYVNMMMKVVTVTMAMKKGFK